MRVTRSKRTVLPLILVPLLSYGCREKAEFCRFIDHIKRENVISSPLIGLEERFDVVEQEWSGREMDLITIDSTPYWAKATERPVLHWGENQEPENLRIFREGEEMEFVPFPRPGLSGWTWMRFGQTIEPFWYKGYKKGGYRIGHNSVILSEGEIFASGEMFFPGGEYTIDVEVQSYAPLVYRPDMALFLDDTLIDEGPVGSTGLSFIAHIPKGMHQIKAGIKKIKESNGHAVREKLILRKITLRMNTDLILISVPEENEGDMPGETFRAVYRGCPKKMVLYPEDFTASHEKQKVQRLTLSLNECVEKNIVLDSEDTTFEIIAYSRSPRAFLSVSIDGKEIGRERIPPQERSSFLFKARTDKGNHILQLQCLINSQESIPQEATLFIHSIVSFPTVTSSLLNLYETKKRYEMKEIPPDENPYSVKSKLVLDKYALNSLLAPPGTQLTLDVRIPGNGILEFGYGICAERERNEEVEFSVKLELSDRTIPLFSNVLDLNQRTHIQDIFMEKIDLTPYKEEKARITLITKSKSRVKTKSEDGCAKTDILSFWFNPVIYRQKQRYPGERANNVILISIDTLRADHLGCYGYERNTSPNIDLFSRDGVLFKNNFCHSPSTLPSHISMLSSLYPFQHKLVSQKVGIRQEFDSSIPLLSDLLRDQEFFTGAFTGGFYLSEKFGFSHGFDFYYENEVKSQRPDSARALYNKAADWLEKNVDKRFFLFLHTYQVHSPYQSPDPYNLMFAGEDAPWKTGDMLELLAKSGEFNKFTKFTEREKENLVALYDAGIRYTDESLIRPLVEKLRELGLYDNSLIILTSDHGEEFYDHGGWTHSHSLYNELLKVPLIIKLPGSQHKGTNVTMVSGIIDIVPTVMDILRIPFSGDKFEGSSLRELVEGNRDEKKLVVGFKYQYFTKPDKSLKIGLMNISICGHVHKLILNEGYPKWHYLYRDPGSFPFPVEKIELFDYIQDPLELKNLAETQTVVANDLMKNLRLYFQKAKELERQFGPSVISDKNILERFKALGYIH